MFDLLPWQWALVIFATFCVGVSKTGIPGLGILTVAIFASLFPQKISTGILLPLLVCADFVAVASYRRHASWPHLLRLFPWLGVGLVVGFFTMKYINNEQFLKLVGVILVVMVLFHITRQRLNAERIPESIWFAAIIGILSGFTTMVANAAGPIIIIYMLAMRLPKMEFLGTGAWYFLAINIVKLPLAALSGLITQDTLIFDAKLAAVAIAGALLGRPIVPHLPQKLFEWLALVLAFLAGLYLLLKRSVPHSP